jgi:hypothetical protein
VRNPTLPVGLSWLLLFAQVPPLTADSGHQQTQSNGQQQNPPTAPPQAEPNQPAPTPTSSDTAKTLLPGQFILQDSTPVKLRLTRNVSSADAHEGDSVDFEVLEDVAANGIVVIPKGAVAIGTVTEAQPKRRMGRAGTFARATQKGVLKLPGALNDELRVRDEGIARWRATVIVRRPRKQMTVAQRLILKAKLANSLFHALVPGLGSSGILVWSLVE